MQTPTTPITPLRTRRDRIVDALVAQGGAAPPGTRTPTHLVTVTGAPGAAVVVTAPTEPGRRHVVHTLEVLRVTTASSAAGASEACGTTNLPGAPAVVVPVTGGPSGTQTRGWRDFGVAGLAAVAVAPVTLSCAATPDVAWTATITYRLEAV